MSSCVYSQFVKHSLFALRCTLLGDKRLVRKKLQGICIIVTVTKLYFREKDTTQKSQDLVNHAR